MYDLVNYVRIRLVAKAKTERGASAVEYGLLVALIAIIIIVAVSALGQALRRLPATRPRASRSVLTGSRTTVVAATGDVATTSPLPLGAAAMTPPEPPTRPRDERGASAVEYALIAVLVAVVVIASVTLFGTRTSALFSSSCASVAAATPTAAC